MVPITFENLLSLATWILFAPVQPFVYVLAFFSLPFLFPSNSSG